jgi:hypothetical protein
MCTLQRLALPCLVFSCPVLSCLSSQCLSLRCVALRCLPLPSLAFSCLVLSRLCLCLVLFCRGTSAFDSCVENLSCFPAFSFSTVKHWRKYRNSYPIVDGRWVSTDDGLVRKYRKSNITRQETGCYGGKVEQRVGGREREREKRGPKEHSRPRKTF